MASESKPAIYAAIAGNLLVAVTKFIATGATGSAAMLSEGFHSLVDTGNGGLLLLGSHRSRRPPDELHPFGYGKELYFWTLIVALSIFAVGGGLSIYEGIAHIRHPAELQDPTWNYVVLGLAFVFEGASLAVAGRQFSRTKRGRTLFEAIRKEKDPTTFSVLFEDSAAILGILAALGGVMASHYFRNPIFDGIASIVIGTILCLVALFLGRESKDLLVGEGADRRMLREIRQVAGEHPRIDQVGKVLTMHFGPETVLLTMEIQLQPDLSVTNLKSTVNEIEDSLRRRFTAIKYIFIEAI